MGLKGWLHQLIADALVVWRSPGVNRPLTRRWMIDQEISGRNKQISHKNKSPKKADQAEPETNPDNVDR